MKKSDLKPGQIYVGKYGTPYLLVSTRIWKRQRYTPRDFVMFGTNYTTPERGQGYLMESKGVLVIKGDLDALRQFDSELLLEFDKFEVKKKGADGGDETEAANLAKLLDTAVRNYTDEDGDKPLWLEIGDYRSWVGTPEQYKAKKEAKEQTRRKERDKVMETARPLRDMAHSLDVRMAAILGVEPASDPDSLSHWRWERSTVQCGDARAWVPTHAKLRIEELEQVVNRAERASDLGTIRRLIESGHSGEWVVAKIRELFQDDD